MNQTALVMPNVFDSQKKKKKTLRESFVHESDHSDHD